MEYQKTTSRTTMDGEHYEVRLSALLFLRCLNDESLTEFQLASNVDGAGALDDVVLRYMTKDSPGVWFTTFLQLKQKSREKLTEGMLHSSSGDFSLQKYRQSMLDIQKKMTGKGEKVELFNGSFENAQFLLFTNLKSDAKLMSRYKDADPPDHTAALLKCDLDTCSVLSFASKHLIDGSQVSNEDIQGDNVLKQFDALELNSKVGEDDDGTGHDLKDDNIDHSVMKRFKIFAGQPNFIQLEQLIKDELIRQGKASESDVDLIYRYYESTIENWWGQKKAFVLDRTSEHYNCALGHFVGVFSQEMKHEWCFDVKFKADEDFRKEVATSSASLLHVSTGSPRLTCTKVLQCLLEGSYFMFDLDFLWLRMRRILLGWASSDRDTLVILCGDHHTGDYNELRDELRTILKENERKRAIVVTQPDAVFVGGLKESCLKYREIEDECSIDQLAEETFQKLTITTVNFQGHHVVLKKILGNVTNTSSLQEILLDDNLMDDISKGKMPTIGKALSDDINCYISRSVERYTLINGTILKADLKSVFAFTGITKEELKQMIHPGESVSLMRSNKFPEKKCRFILLNKETRVKDFEILCKRTKDRSIHWLHKYGPYFQWKSSIGLLVELRPYTIKELTPDVYELHTFVDVTGNQKIVILDGEPGMGKTTLLSHIARKTKEKFPFLWVIHVDFTKHLDLVENICGEIEFLSSALDVKASPFVKSLLKYVIKVTGNAFVAADGYNEIYRECGIQIIGLIEKLLKTNLKKFWLTSQSVSTPDLEKQFSTLAIHIKAFSEVDQAVFLSRYWSEHMGISRPLSDLQLLAVDLLRKVITSLSNAEQLFTGNPLQIMMLAEVYTDFDNLPEDLNFSNCFEAFVEKKFLKYLNNKKIPTRDLSILMPLRKFFIDQHLEASLVYLLPRHVLDEIHEKNKIIEHTNEFVLELKANKQSTGIIDGVLNNGPKFVHRYFAEYFAAKWFSKHYKENRSFIRNRLFDNYYRIVWKFLNSMLASGKELHLAVLSNDIQRAEELIRNGAEVNSKDLAGRTPLHLAAGGDFEMSLNIVTQLIPMKFEEKVLTIVFAVLNLEMYIDNRFIGPTQHMVHVLLQNGADVNVRDDFVNDVPLYYAVWTFSWHNAEVLLRYGAIPDDIKLQLHFDLPIDLPLIIMHLIEQGFTSLVKLMLNLNMCLPHKLLLVELSIVNGHLELVKLLVKKGKDVLTSMIESRTLLHQASRCGQIQILEYLLQTLSKDMGKGVCKERINQLDNHSYSPMLIACLNGWDAAVVELMKWGGDLNLLKHDFPKIFLSCCVFDYLEIIERIAIACSNDSEYMSKCINYIDDEGNSNLIHATASNHLRVFDYLMNHGANVKVYNKHGMHALMCVVSRNFFLGTKTIIDCFSDDRTSLELLINKGDITQMTLVQFACMPFFLINYSWFTNVSEAVRDSHVVSRAKIVRLLVSNGGDVTLEDNVGNTALHQASMSFNCNVVQVLIDSFGGESQSLADYINRRNKDMLTAVHCALNAGIVIGQPALSSGDLYEWFSWQQLETVRLLLAHGGNTTVSDKEGRTPLHCAFNHALNIEVAKVVLAKFEGDGRAKLAYLGAKDLSGRTARDCARESPFLTEAQIVAMEAWYDRVVSECEA